MLSWWIVQSVRHDVAQYTGMGEKRVAHLCEIEREAVGVIQLESVFAGKDLGIT